MNAYCEYPRESDSLLDWVGARDIVQFTRPAGGDARAGLVHHHPRVKSSGLDRVQEREPAG